MDSVNAMGDKEFIDFLNTQTTKGGATFNLHTQNCSKQARDILSKTKYTNLAKQHINANIVDAYNKNKSFATKLEQVLTENNITLVA